MVANSTGNYAFITIKRQLKKRRNFGIVQRIMKRLIVALLLQGTFLATEEQHTIEVYSTKIPFLFDSKKAELIIKLGFLRQLPSLTLAQLLSFAAKMNFVSRGYLQASPGHLEVSLRRRSIFSIDKRGCFRTAMRKHLTNNLNTDAKLGQLFIYRETGGS